MNCPEQILVSNGLFLIMMHGGADIPKRLVPLKWWLNPLRYEVIIWLKPKRIQINKDGKWNRLGSNFVYKHIRPKLCRWFGVHQRMDFRGGEKLCHHCDTGRQD